jgi:hypothetical protein
MKLDFSQAVRYLQNEIDKWNQSPESDKYESFLFIKAYKRLNRSSLKKHLQKKYEDRLERMKQDDEKYMEESKNWIKIKGKVKEKRTIRGLNTRSIITSNKQSKIIVDTIKVTKRRGFDCEKQLSVNSMIKEYVSTNEVLATNSKNNIYCELEISDEPVEFTDEIYDVSELEVIKWPLKIRRSYDQIDEPIDKILADFKDCESKYMIIDDTLKREKLIEERNMLVTCIEKMNLMKTRIMNMRMINHNPINRGIIRSEANTHNQSENTVITNNEREQIILNDNDDIVIDDDNDSIISYEDEDD